MVQIQALGDKIDSRKEKGEFYKIRVASQGYFVPYGTIWSFGKSELHSSTIQRKRWKKKNSICKSDSDISFMLDDIKWKRNLSSFMNVESCMYRLRYVANWRAQRFSSARIQHFPCTYVNAHIARAFNSNDGRKYPYWLQEQHLIIWTSMSQSLM